MTKILFCFWFTVCCFFVNASTTKNNLALSNTEMQEFNQSAFNLIKQQYLGKQWLMILWSVDCPACFKELALVEQLKANTPEISVVIVNTDAENGIDIKIERENIIASYQLSTLPNFYFPHGKGDHSRFLIDKNWYGELPRSYFVESNGTFHGKSGIVDKALLTTWLIEAK